jgi:uncharacterized protein with ParB-like and HNH nuclease domain
LGILTAESAEQDYLSIVDGQQRLTTTVLLLAWLYNACAEEGERENQQEILELLTYSINNSKEFVLSNASVGNFLKSRNFIKIYAKTIKICKLWVNQLMTT